MTTGEKTFAGGVLVVGVGLVGYALYAGSLPKTEKGANGIKKAGGKTPEGNQKNIQNPKGYAQGYGFAVAEQNPKGVNDFRSAAEGVAFQALATGINIAVIKISEDDGSNIDSTPDNSVNTESDNDGVIENQDSIRADSTFEQE